MNGHIPDKSVPNTDFIKHVAPNKHLFFRGLSTAYVLTEAIPVLQLGQTKLLQTTFTISGRPPNPFLQLQLICD